jgi:ParB-like chromosome segregation protein Spo0J
MAKKQPTQPVEETRRLEKLAEHPLQWVYSDGMTPQDFAALAADIAENGLREKIEVLPANRADLSANTILDGHRRRRALLRNGETSTTAIVRYDLAQSDALTVERAFLMFNLHRGHEDLLLSMHKAMRLYYIEKGKPLSEQAIDGQREARDRIGQLFGLSGRSLNRYFRVLWAPFEVENAFRNGQLPLFLAEKVIGLESAAQLAIAGRISAGEDPKEVVLEYLPQRKVEPKTASPLEYPRLALVEV